VGASSMRCLALLVIVLPSVGFAQNAPANPPNTKPQNDDKPKGKIIDPWGRMPHPRDKMRLPDPRHAAEKATDDGTVAPAPPEPAAPTAPPPEPQVAAEPAAAPAFVPPPAVVPLPPASTPFGTTKFEFIKPPAPARHDGLTLEAGTGIGWIHVADRSDSVTSPGGVAGLSIGIGGWLNEKIALTARIAGSSVPSSQGLVVAAFLGPSVQLWVGESTWLGLGLGLATFAVGDASLDGYAGDLRLGHVIYANGKHTLNASFEVTPGHVSEKLQYGGTFSLDVASIGLLFGWQYL